MITPTSSLLSGYIDRSGAFVIAPHLRTAERFDPAARLARAVPFGGVGRSGIIDATGKWIVEPTVQVNDWRDGYCAFNVGGSRDDEGRVVGGLWGIAGEGVVLCAPRFAMLGGHGKGLLPFRDGDTWGYVDVRGNVVIAATFDRTWEFTADGVAVAAHGGGEGLLGPDGAWILPPDRFSELDMPRDGRTFATTDDGKVMIDFEGRVLGDPVEKIWTRNAKMSIVLIDDRWQVVGLDGQAIGDGEGFDDVRDPDGGIAPVKRDEEWFLLDAAGTLHGPWANALVPAEGLARVIDEDGKIGFFSASAAAVVVEPRYDDSRGFSGGRAAVQRDGLWTHIDATGRELAPPSWTAARSFAEGLAIVRRGTETGAIDADGNVVVAPGFTTIDSFSGGLAAARRVTYPAVAPPPAEWHVTPPAGLAFAGFADAGVEDDLRVMVCFREHPDDARAIQMQQLLDNWIQCADHLADGDAVREHSKWVADYAITLRFGGAPNPVPLAALLLEEFRALGLPIQDVVLGRYRPTDHPALSMIVGWRAVPHPDDPHGESFFDTFEAYAEAAFDAAGTPPSSESVQHLLAGRWNQRAEALAFDERTFTLHHPRVRICYGVKQGDFLDADERSEAIALGVEAAIAKRFDGLWFFPPNRYQGPPSPFTREGDPGVEPIELDLDAGARRGYCFALSSDRLIHDVGPATFRWREPELMEALADAVETLGLAPVIMWQRFGDPLPGPAYPGWAHPMNPTVYVFNLWEK